MHGFNSYFLVICFCYYCYHHCCSHPLVYEVEHSECFGINGLENVTLIHHTFVVYNMIHQTIVVYNCFIYSIDFLKFSEIFLSFFDSFSPSVCFVFIIFAFIFKVWPAVLDPFVQDHLGFVDMKHFYLQHRLFLLTWNTFSCNTNLLLSTPDYFLHNIKLFISTQNCFLCNINFIS